MSPDFFVDMIIAGVIVTFMGLPIWHRRSDGRRVRLPKDPRAMRSFHGFAYVSFAAWYVGRALLVIGAIGLAISFVVE